MKSVDILVAVRNEEKAIPMFIEKVNKLTPDNVEINIIFLEDGSNDGTVNVLRDFSKKLSNIEFISLDNKYGQYAALFYGLGISKADAVITMDVDGGHPVETAVEMIRAYLNGNNLVQGHRIIYKRKKLYRTILSYVYNLFFYLIVGVNFLNQNVMFRLMDKLVKEKFLSHKNWWHIFKTNFTKKDSINDYYIDYAAPERELGESKYGFFRLLKLSFKSFFSLMSVKRFIVINIIFICLFILFVYYGLIIPGILILVFLVVFDISHYSILNHNPIPFIKITETSLPELKG